MSPLLNTSYWQERIGRSTPSYSGERWLDWCHQRVIAWTLRRLWADLGSPRRVLEVGCADGRWTEWMQRHLGVKVMGVDAIEYPEIRKVADLFIQCDPEQLDKVREAKRFNPDVVLYLNTLTTVQDWRRAVQAGAHVGAPFTFCFDNFMRPTPAWAKGSPSRVSIEWPALEYEWALHGYEQAQYLVGDYFHRRLFLSTPRWSHPLVAGVTLALDWAASHVLGPYTARHLGILFETASTVQFVARSR